MQICSSSVRVVRPQERESVKTNSRNQAPVTLDPNQANRETWTDGQDNRGLFQWLLDPVKNTESRPGRLPEAESSGDKPSNPIKSEERSAPSESKAFKLMTLSCGSCSAPVSGSGSCGYCGTQNLLVADGHIIR